MYIKLKGDDQLCACIKGIVFCMIWLVSGKNNRIHIPMIESVFYHFDNVIVQFVLLLSLCKNDINLSDIIETLSKADKNPLDQLMAVAVILGNSFLRYLSQESKEQEFVFKMDMICNAMRIILQFWRNKRKQNGNQDQKSIGQDILLVCRQLYMKTLGMRHKWIVNVSSSSSSSVPQKQIPLDMMVALNHGFLKEKNILLDVIKTACNAGNWTIQHRTRFVYDLLCVVQHVEDWDNDTCQTNFRYTLETIYYRLLTPFHFSKTA
ncbi:hypothetical protein RFI_34917 [Reticulomyxa filosa]|uniref:Uncharacterized protein n=1 Tax=Reticulomyxa filosa TaxID=46433 RepID=X6LKP6_RETFI|nr:hypothetical protein RFI_34917 [Reticulomyxa filosa]|eukprot:ETO02513.1 hypothetical protein RFI_34917 [Reticulomyxa filosa]